MPSSPPRNVSRGSTHVSSHTSRATPLRTPSRKRRSQSAASSSQSSSAAAPPTVLLTQCPSQRPGSREPPSESISLLPTADLDAALFGPLPSFNAYSRRGRPTSASGPRSGSRLTVTTATSGTLAQTPPPSLLGVAVLPLQAEAWQPCAADEPGWSTSRPAVARPPAEVSLQHTWTPATFATAHVSWMFETLEPTPQFPAATLDDVEYLAEGRSTVRSSLGSAPAPLRDPSPLPFMVDFACSPGSGTSLPTPPHACIRRRTAAGNGTSITPAPSSCLPSEPLGLRSVPQSPLLSSLSMSPAALALGGLGPASPMPFSPTRHRSAASVESEWLLVRPCRAVAVPRWAALASPPPAPEAPPTIAVLDAAVHAVANGSPNRRDFRAAALSPEEPEGSPPSIAGVRHTGAPASFAIVGVGDSALRDRAESQWTRGSLDGVPAFRGVTAFSPNTVESGDQLEPDMNRNSRLTSLTSDQRRTCVLHRLSAEQQRNSVNGTAEAPQHALKSVAASRNRRKSSQQQGGAIELQRERGL